jgi:hypothetical protein
MEGRYLRNLKSGRVLVWTKVLDEREDMVECDAKGNIKVDRSAVSDVDLMKALDAKVRECIVLVEEKAKMLDELKKFRLLYGPLDSALKEKSVDEIIEKVGIKVSPPKRGRKPKKDKAEAPKVEEKAPPKADGEDGEFKPSASEDKEK